MACVILSFTIYQTVEGNLVLGSLLSLFMGISVVSSYIMIIPWRKHPSSLVLYRSLTSALFSINIIFQAITTDDSSCRNFAVLTQMTVLAGECWQTTIALDLVYSLSNPFVSYQTNLKKYHILVWIFTSLISFIFYFNSDCQGQFDQGICWVNITSTNSPCLWGYFLFWVVCMYAFQIYATMYAYLRLQKGLPATFEIRRKCAVETFQSLMVYATYLSVLVLMFCVISSDPTPDAGSPIAKFSLFFLFLIANKGSVDGVVWFMLHNFSQDGGAPYSPLQNEQTVDDASVLESGSSKHNRNDLIHEVGGEIKKSVTNTITELADLAIAELDEADLSPQVNVALRQQIVQYVTKGVRNSVLNINTSNKPETEIIDIFDSFFMKRDIAVVPGLQIVEFFLDNEYLFKSFAPDLFRQLRHNEGINDDLYLSTLAASANERLSEGASGAFMFFCGGGEYIVKTIRAREAKVLHKSLKSYAEHLQRLPSSLLSRILGSYSLEMYSQTFYFVVMRNCFDPGAYINERFDIKGSWVGRSAEPTKKSKKVICRHCNEYFVPVKQQQCKAIVGKHEENIVLKDNDMRTKISLHKKDAVKIISVLKQDSELLGRLGVLDYSLLIGIKKWKFNVDISDDIVAYHPVSTKPPDTFNHDQLRATCRAKSVTGPALYHFGIIDFLQNWTFQKQMERVFKTYFMRKDPDGLSVMPPHDYKVDFRIG